MWKTMIAKKPLGLSLMVAGSIILASGFQNCSNQDLNSSLVTPPEEGRVNSSNIDKIPFAYDFRVNELSYMSCSRSNDKSQNTDGEQVFASTTHLSDPNVFYTFKVLSHDGAGLTFRREFIDFVKENFSVQGVLNDTEIQDALSFGTAHGGAALQLAIRESNPIATQVQYFGENSAPTPGVSFDLFPMRNYLATKEFLPQLVALFKNPSARINSLGSSGLQKYPLEAAIHQENVEGYNELTAETVRNRLQSEEAISTLLSVTYSKDLRMTENTGNYFEARRAPSAASDNRVWGTGFKLKFTSDYLRMRWKQNVVASIKEYDLSTFEPTSSSWECPQDLRYIIVSPKDRVVSPVDQKIRYPCNDVADESVLNPVQKKDLALLRRHLKPSEWIIDLSHQCVSPRRSNLNCYGNFEFNEIDYWGTGTRCGLDDNNYYLHKDCAEFVSVCLRK